MGEAIALALKFGVSALPLIVSEWGLMAGAIAFFAFMPLGHLTLGVGLLLFGAFVPRLPGDDDKHVINVGGSKSKIAIKGNARTALMAGGLVIIVGSIGEWMLK
jgi:hypothetical protein